MKKFTNIFAVLVMSTVIAVSYSETSQAKNSVEKTNDKIQLEFETQNDRFSYAYGVDLAEKFQSGGFDLNVAIFATAMQDFFDGGEMQMSPEEIVATIELYQKVHKEKEDAEWAAATEKNQREGKQFLAENAKKEGVMVTESGLQYKVITKGNGGHKPTIDDELTVHYRGTFIDGTEFDSSYKRNQATELNIKQLIDGWAEALQLMTKGAKWEITIPAELAYRERGSGQHIGPHAVLIFEVELLDIEIIEK